MLWYLPLEYLDKRYTILMDKQLKKGFDDLSIEYMEVIGDLLTTEIKTGAFLDSNGTNYFKFSQLQKICKLFNDDKINDGDVFFVSDLWFPGIISIPYMSMFQGIETKICGMMHAGSWTDTDYVNKLKSWARDVESGWFELFDAVFLGSDFHRNDILSKIIITNPEKLIVTGLPFSTDDIYSFVEKRLVGENIVVLTGRLDDEKQPWVFDSIAKKFPKSRFIKTMELNLNKKEYFELLSKSKIVFSAALQENFGYGVLEAVALGCVPVVPNTLAYKEMYPRCFRYDNFDEAVKLVDHYLCNQVDVSYIPQYYNDSVERILSYVKRNFIIS